MQKSFFNVITITYSGNIKAIVTQRRCNNDNALRKHVYQSPLKYPQILLFPINYCRQILPRTI